MLLANVQLPYTVHRVLADPLRLCHEPATPMGHTLGLALQGRFNDPVSLLLHIVHFASATESDLPNLPDALLVHHACATAAQWAGSRRAPRRSPHSADPPPLPG